MMDNKRITTIDEYISTFPGEMQAVLEQVRQTIHHAAPQAVETMSYRMPTFDLGGKHVVFFAGWKQHISLYPLPAGDEAFQDEAARQAWKAYRKRLVDVLAQGQRGDALALFMLLVGMPAEHLDRVRQHPLWPMWEAAAPTLAYDAAIMGEEASIPTEKAAHVAVPTLIMDGSASFPFMHVTAMALANAIPNAEHRTLEDQTHEVAVTVLAPVLVEFFNR